MTTQFVRHIYVRYLEPRSSVLDTYEQTETKKAIKGAASLDELVSRYDAAKKRIDELDKQRKRPKRTSRRMTGTSYATNSEKSIRKTMSGSPT